MSDDYFCSRCGQGFVWERMKSTPSGNLFCPDCWPKIDAKSEPIRKCPVDGSDMQRLLVAELVLIDVCKTCGGSWFDKDELAIIRTRAKDAGWGDGFVIGWLVG